MFMTIGQFVIDSTVLVCYASGVDILLCSKPFKEPL